MESDRNLTPNDNKPEFFSNDNKNIEKLSDKKNDVIHWKSLLIGAGIAIACIFCGVLLVNMINADSSQVLDEITIKEITTIKKQTIASF